MPWPLLFATKYNIKNLDTSSNPIKTSIEIDTNKEDNDKYNWHELTIEEHNLLFRSWHRIYIYWRQLVYNKIRFILSLVFTSALNLATRLPCFTRQQNKSYRPASSLSSIVNSPSIRIFQVS
jgi:hypothetical protein